MVQNRGNTNAYVSGGDHRPIPLATEASRPAGVPRPPRPTGLDWAKHQAAPAAVLTMPTERPCKECRTSTPLADLDRDGFCPVCLDLATARFSPTGTTPAVTRPTKEVAKVAAPETVQPSYVTQITDLMVATEGHVDAGVRTARKAVANALVALRQAVRAADSHALDPAADQTPKARRYTRLTSEQVDEVVRRYEAGEAIKPLAREYDVSFSTVHRHLHLRGVAVRARGRTTL